MDEQSDFMHGITPGTTSQVDPSSAFPIAGDAGTASGTGTGQYGIAPSVIGGAMGNVFSSTWAWVNRPFNTPMSPVDIFLLVGVIAVVLMLWSMILYHIRIAAEAL